MTWLKFAPAIGDKVVCKFLWLALANNKWLNTEMVYTEENAKELEM